MGNKQKDKTKEADQSPASPNIDLTAYEFTYRSEPTFVVPLIDFISGLAPLQSPITKEPLTKKEEMEQDENENKSRFKRYTREFLSHELVEAFSINPFKPDPSQLSEKLLELGGLLGFEDNISNSVLEDAGRKLTRFYRRVYIIYCLICLPIAVGIVMYLFFVPSVAPYEPPIVSPTASLSAPTGEPSSAPTGEPSGAPTGVPSSVPTGVPSSVPPTESPKVAPIGGVNPQMLFYVSLLFSPISGLFGLFFLFMVIRLGILVAGKKYASTLCLLASFYIVFELEQDDILSIDRIKNRLLNRSRFSRQVYPFDWSEPFS